MTKWQRFGDRTWVNVDHVEVVQVDEQEDGGWQLMAVFASGHTHPLGSHADRDLLVDCTDALLRGEVGEHLRALADTGAEPSTEAGMQPAPDPAMQPEAAPAKRRRWWVRRSDDQWSPTVIDVRPEAEPIPVS